MKTLWQPYTPGASNPWDTQRAVHLFRRAAFGATAKEVERALSEGPEETINRLFSGELNRPGGERVDRVSKLLADSATSTNSIIKLKSAWILRMLTSNDPLREQLTLMWHDHFATSHLKVADAGMMRQQNQLLREHGFGNFPNLLNLVLRDPAMLVWLDATSNTKEAPNENLARELMELFTLGIRNYTESDVKEVARTLTGRGLDDEQRMTDDPATHDSGEKTILGQTSNYKPDDLVTFLAEQPACAKRIVWRACRHFIGHDVITTAELNDLAKGFVANHQSVRWLVGAILRSNVFFGERTIDRRIVPPVDFAMSAIRTLRTEDRPSPSILADWLAEMGQDLFLPPNVAGWPGGRAWLSPQRMIARMRFAQALSRGELRSPIQPVRAQTATQDPANADPDDIVRLADLLGTNHHGGALTDILSSPEAQID